MIDLGQLDFDTGGGLVTVVTQDARTGVVLMVAHADRDALARAIETGEMHYRSRSRGLWHKGATSGNTQAIVSLERDCDGDAVLARVIPRGPACHTNTVSCFGDAALAADALGALDRTVRERAANPAPAAPGERPSYTRRLLEDRNLRLKKLGEEAAELAVAAADGNAERATEEAADLVYHALVALRGVGVGWDELRATLWTRMNG